MISIRLLLWMSAPILSNCCWTKTSDYVNNALLVYTERSLCISCMMWMLNGTIRLRFSATFRKDILYVNFENFITMLLHIIIFSFIINYTEGNYGPGNPSSCPVSCDVLAEIDSLRQLINQEGLFRMNLDRQLNDLKDIVKSISEEKGLLEGKVLRLENETLASSSGE